MHYSSHYEVPFIIQSYFATFPEWRRHKAISSHMLCFSITEESLLFKKSSIIWLLKQNKWNSHMKSWIWVALERPEKQGEYYEGCLHYRYFEPSGPATVWSQVCCFDHILNCIFPYSTVAFQYSDHQYLWRVCVLLY